MRITALTALVAVVVTAGAAACGPSRCKNVARDHDALTGTAVYRPASTTTPFEMSGASLWSLGRSTLEIDVTMKSVEGTRAVHVALTDLREGATQTLGQDAHGEACLVLQTNAAPTCLALAGTVEVRRLSSDCYNHESGVSLCAENVDVSLHATADERGLSMRLDLDVSRAEHWTDAACSDEDNLF